MRFDEVVINFWRHRFDELSRGFEEFNKGLEETAHSFAEFIKSLEKTSEQEVTND